MDVIVTALGSETEWSLTDLLGRSMGRVVLTAERQFMIEPGGLALETMAGMRKGPFGSLDDALATVETHTRGVCRRNDGEDGA